MVSSDSVSLLEKTRARKLIILFTRKKDEEEEEKDESGARAKHAVMRSGYGGYTKEFTCSTEWSSCSFKC